MITLPHQVHLCPPPVAGSHHTCVGMVASVWWTFNSEESEYLPLTLMIFEGCSCLSSSPESMDLKNWSGWFLLWKEIIALPQILTSVSLTLSAPVPLQWYPRWVQPTLASALDLQHFALCHFKIILLVPLKRRSALKMKLELAACRNDYSHIWKLFKVSLEFGEINK